MRSLARWELALLMALFVYGFIPIFGGLFRVVELAGGPALVPPNPRALAAPLPVVLHVVGSVVFCLLGALQFLPGVRRHWPSLHRRAGSVVAAAGMISALTGVWMTHGFDFPQELQGIALYCMRIGIGMAMVVLILRAVIATRHGNVPAHGAAMLRAYSIAQGASTQALLGMVWIAFAGAAPAGPARDALMILAWAVNLLVAEGMIARLGHRP